MSTKINLSELSAWYLVSEIDGEELWAEVRKDVLIIDYQTSKITAGINTSYYDENGNVVKVNGLIVTDSFDKFEMRIP